MSAPANKNVVCELDVCYSLRGLHCSEDRCFLAFGSDAEFLSSRRGQDVGHRCSRCSTRVDRRPRLSNTVVERILLPELTLGASLIALGLRAQVKRKPVPFEGRGDELVGETRSVVAPCAAIDDECEGLVLELVRRGEARVGREELPEGDFNPTL